MSFSNILHPWKSHTRFLRRVHEILQEAPWSNFDLLSALIVLCMGLHLWVRPGVFSHYEGIFRTMSNLADERFWGSLFLVCGACGVVGTLWCERPPFGVRLLARMGVAFCVAVVAWNHWLYPNPPLSTWAYTLLSIGALWSICRTKASGR